MYLERIVATKIKEVEMLAATFRWLRLNLKFPGCRRQKDSVMRSRSGGTERWG